MNLKKVWESLPKAYSYVENLKIISSLWKAAEGLFLSVSSTAKKTEHLSPFVTDETFDIPLIYVTLDEHGLVSNDKLLSFREASTDGTAPYLSKDDYLWSLTSQGLVITGDGLSIKGLYLHDCVSKDSSVCFKFSPHKVGIDISVYDSPTHVTRALLGIMGKQLTKANFTRIMSILSGSPFMKFFGIIYGNDLSSVCYEVVVSLGHEAFLKAHGLSSEYVFISVDGKKLYSCNYPEEPLILAHVSNIKESDGSYELKIKAEHIQGGCIADALFYLIKKMTENPFGLSLKNETISAECLIDESPIYVAGQWDPVFNMVSVADFSPLNTNPKVMPFFANNSQTLRLSAHDFSKGDLVEMKYLVKINIHAEIDGQTSVVLSTSDLPFETGMVLYDQSFVRYTIVDGRYDEDLSKYVIVLDGFVQNGDSLFFYTYRSTSSYVSETEETIVKLETPLMLTDGAFQYGLIKVSAINEVFSYIVLGTIEQNTLRRQIKTDGQFSHGDIVSIYNFSRCHSFSVDTYLSGILTLTADVPYEMGDEFYIKNDTKMESYIALCSDRNTIDISRRVLEEFDMWSVTNSAKLANAKKATKLIIGESLNIICNL